jgi:hypothetical protein
MDTTEEVVDHRHLLFQHCRVHHSLVSDELKKGANLVYPEAEARLVLLSL